MLNLKDFLHKKQEKNAQISCGKQKQNPIGKNQPIEYQPAIEHCIQILLDNGIDMTLNYDDWVEIGFAFASLGEEGRSNFHQVSSLYPTYNYQMADQKFDSLLKDYRGNIQIGTFFHYCKQYGITLPKDLATLPNCQNHVEVGSTNRESELVIFNGYELLKREMKEIPKLIDPIFPRKGLASLVGGSDNGKSALLRQLALSVVNDSERFLGFPVKATHKRAIYVSTEDDDEAMSFLIGKQVNHLHHEYELYRKIEFIFSFGSNLVKALEKRLTQNPADLVIIDAFSDIFSGQLNLTNDVRSFLNDFSQLANRHDCLVIFLHHTGKKTENLEPNKNNVIGSQGFESKMRTVIELRADWYNEDLRHFCIVKGNYLSKEYKRDSFVLRMDDNFLFYNTGDRESFENLAKPTEKGSQDTTERNQQILEMANQGMSVREISKEVKLSKSQVGEIVKNAREN